MYELRNGTARLINALDAIKEDSGAIEQIAQATNYLPQQLKEDIQALYDFYIQALYDFYLQAKEDKGE